jgi:hypothetical protein
MGRSFRVLGVGWGERDLVVTLVGTMTYTYKRIYNYLFMYTSNAVDVTINVINRLTPNDPYMCRTAPLTSKRCILYTYSTNIGTEYLKHALYSPFFLFKMQFVS